MAGLRNKGPLRSLITDDEASNAELLTPDEGFVPDISQTFVGGDFQAGLQSASRGVEAGGFFRKADQAEAKGDIEQATALREHAIRIEESAAGFAPRVGSSADVESFGDAIDFAQAGLGQLAPTMAATSVPGIIGGVAGGILTGGNPLGVAAGAGLAAGFTGFQLEAGEAASEQQKDEIIKALPVEERLREQNIKGAQAAALELVFPTMVGGRLAGSVAKIFKKLETAEDIAKAAKKTKQLKTAGRVGVAETTVEEGGGAIKNVLLETVSEAGTEASQTLVAQASLNRLNPLRDRSNDIQELIDATILGGLGGGGISLGTTVPGALAKRVLSTTDAEVDAEGNIKPGAGARIRDAAIAATAGVTEGVARVKDTVLQEAAETGGKVKAKVKDSDIPFIAKNVKDAVKGVADKVGESDVPFILKNVAAAAKDKADEIGQRVSQAEIDRRARLRKSAFSPAARADLITPEDQLKQESEDAAAVEDFVASSRFEASAEEIVGLRELGPVAKEESKGQRRFVRLQKADVDSHLQDLVTRGVITQEVANAAKVEPLGTNLKRKGASVQELENTLASIVRDLMTRIEGNRKQGGTKTEIADRSKALESELANLPLDVSKRGETITEGVTTTTVEKKPSRGTKKGTKGQAELFPGDIGKTFPVEVSEFKKNHFGFQLEVQTEPVQGELGLGKVNRKDLLVQALNNYGQVLASDATVEAAPTTVAEHKANRSKYAQATREEKRELERTGKVLRLRKKNGQNEIVDVESLIQTALAADREGIVGGIRGKAQQDQAALLSGLAKEILRNDIEGVVDPATNEVARGSRQQDLFGAFVEGTPALSAETRTAEVKETARKGKRLVGKRPRKELESDDIRLVISSKKRADIQKGFAAARKEHLKIADKETVDARIKTLSKAAKAQRKVLADLKKFNKEFADNKETGEGSFQENKKLVAALKLKYGAEVGVLFGNAPRKGTAEFRADRLEALVEELRERQFEEGREAPGVAEEIEGGRAETLEVTGVRHAEEQTGAGTQVRVGQPVRGESRQKKVSKKASARAKSQSQTLAARLSKVASVQAARTLIPKVLGYKNVGKGLFDVNGTVVMLGNLSKGAARAVANEAGVPVKGTIEVLPGERVTVLVAKANLPAVIKSNEFAQLMVSGAQLVMPVIDGPMRVELTRNGYKAQKQGDGIEVWVPEIASDGGARFMSGLLQPFQKLVAPEAIIEAVEAAVGDIRSKNISYQYSDEKGIDIGDGETIQKGGVTLGVYHTTTGDITLFLDTISSPQQAAWVAWHELTHRGLDAGITAGSKNQKALRELLDQAGVNKTVAAIGKRIQELRDIDSKRLGIEEALAELGAAMKTGDFARIRESYGVEVSMEMMTGKRPIKGFVERLLDIVRSVLGIDTGDRYIYEILDYVLDESISGKKFKGSQNKAAKARAELTKLRRDLLQKAVKHGTMARVARAVRQLNKNLDGENALIEAINKVYQAAAAKGFRFDGEKLEVNVVGLRFKFEDADVKDFVNQFIEMAEASEAFSELMGDSIFGDKSLKFSRESGVGGKVKPLTAKQRAFRKKQVKGYLARVLGSTIADKFRDVLRTEIDAAGSFDWKEAVIEVAIDSVGYMGAARHEAFHAFFNKMAKIDGARNVYNRLIKASNAPHIKRQLRALLKDSPEALAQLTDPEERLAYMFQFYASGQINLQPQTMKTFRKWARKFGELVGMVSTMESAERIFKQFETGKLQTNWDIRNMIMEEQSTGLARNISSILNPIGGAFAAVLKSATQRLRDTNNVSLTRIADLFAPDVKAGGEAGFLAQRAQKEAQLRNQRDAIFNKHEKGMDEKTARKSRQEALRLLQGQKDVEPGTLAADLRDFMQEMFDYLRDADGDTFSQDGSLLTVSPNAVQEIVEFINGEPQWQPIKDSGPKYFPRVWDHTTILQNWDEFKKLMAEEGGPTGQELRDFRSALEAGDGMMDIDNNNSAFDAQMRAVNSRTFDFITEANAHKFSKFQEQDLDLILTTYTRQAAHRGEQTRHFGHDNQRLLGLLEDAKKEGASKDELEMADKAVRALEGTLGSENMTPMKKNLMMGAMTAVNFAVLPLALFSSLVDPLGVLVRTGSAPAAARTFVAGTKQIIADIRGNKIQGQQLAEFLGIVEQEQMLAVTGDSYNSMFMNETLRKANARFFKLIGLDSWTKGTRIGAMQAGMLYLRDNATNKRALDELGLKAGDIEMIQERMPDGRLGAKTVVETRPEVLGKEKARRVQAAIFRMVDESILRPTAAQRPIFMSDMRFMLLGHLKQFTFSFHNTIVKQVVGNINEQLDNQEYVKAMQQLAPILMYVPFMIAADMLRALVGGRTDDNDDEEFSLADMMFEGVQRSAVLGVNTFALDAGEEAFKFGTGLPINTFLGPVIAKGVKLTESAVDPDQSFNRAAVKMLPGYAFWKGWME